MKRRVLNTTSHLFTFNQMQKVEFLNIYRQPAKNSEPIYTFHRSVKFEVQQQIFKYLTIRESKSKKIFLAKAQQELWTVSWSSMVWKEHATRANCFDIDRSNGLAGLKQVREYGKCEKSCTRTKYFRLSSQLRIWGWMHSDYFEAISFCPIKKSLKLSRMCCNVHVDNTIKCRQ